MAEAGLGTILVIDDEPDIVRLVTETLEMEGYTIRTASNGQEGLNALQESLPDLILLDMKMPLMNGIDFARKFRASFDHAVPIVVLTAEAEARLSAERTGAAGWLGKPFDLDDLVLVVESHIYLGRSS